MGLRGRRGAAGAGALRRAPEREEKNSTSAGRGAAALPSRHVARTCAVPGRPAVKGRAPWQGRRRWVDGRKCPNGGSLWARGQPPLRFVVAPFHCSYNDVQFFAFHLGLSRNPAPGICWAPSGWRMGGGADGAQGTMPEGSTAATELPEVRNCGQAGVARVKRAPPPPNYHL